MNTEKTSLEKETQPSCLGDVMLSLPSNEIEAILLDCRNMLRQCQSTTIGQTQINVKIIQIENLYRKLKLGNGA
jgi:hypothetical protein